MDMQAELHALWDQFKAHPYYRQTTVNTERAIIDNRAYTKWHLEDPDRDQQYPWNGCVIMWTDYQDDHKAIKTNYDLAALRAMLSKA